ncbi:MAG: alpha/beta fold hydrolase [Chlamydiales bacterium]|nr:alpha/beta fold hydrolase [Chlamydiales bacterium]
MSIITGVPMIYSMSVEAALMLVSFCLYPTFGLLNKKNRRPENTERPILLVHGYLHNASAWLYLTHRLAKEGFGSTYAINLWPPFCSIERYVELVKDRVKKIQEETGRQDVLLIGHSMGGLVVSQAALDLSLSQAITLGSPLRGTPVAYIGLGKNAKQMHPGSLFTTQLQQKLLNNKTVRFLHVGSKADGVVPEKYALPEPSALAEQFSVADLGHMSLLYSPRIARKILDWV